MALSVVQSVTGVRDKPVIALLGFSANGQFMHAPLPQYPAKMSEGWNRRRWKMHLQNVYGEGITDGHKEQ